MSVYGSQRSLSRRNSSRSDIAVPPYPYGGNGFGQEHTENYSRTFSRGSMGGGQGPPRQIYQTASILQSQCQDILNKAEFVLQTDADRARAAAEAEHCMMSARDIIERLTGVAVDLRNMGQPNDNVLMMVDDCTAQLRAVHMALGGSMHRINQGSMSWDETNITLQDALGWINQQKRLIETSPWAEDPSAIEQQIMNHNRFHNSIQRSVEVERAQAELRERQDKGGLHMLEQEWDSLQKMSFERGAQLQELQNIIAEMTHELMWVNDREEEELMFDWGNKNIDVYIPQKQESYSRLMSDLEEKEKHLTKLKQKVDNLLSNNHPASDKIEAYMDTLQTQWSWLLQITKCIPVHLKENAAYSQFFTEANEINGKLQQQHDGLRKNFKCDKTTPLTTLQEMLKGIENEQEYMAEHRQRIQQLVSKSRNIVRLRPRNPDEKSSNVKVQALCDFRQDQKVICKGDIGILKDNSERSKWLVTGPGGLDMEVPSVCLLVPPPNPLCVSLASKNEQYYEALQAVWNQLFINIKSLISWQYCLHDISRINSLTITMLAQMRPEEYRCIIKSLETHYQEYQRNCLGSEVFEDEDKRAIENQYTGAQKRYNQLIVQLPSYDGQQEVSVDASVNLQSQMSAKVSSGVNVLSELHALLLKLEAVESAVNTHQHIPVGHEAPAECTSLITSTQAVVQNVESLREEFQRLNERTLAETKGMKDTDKAQFLQSQLNMMNQRLDRLGSHFAAYLQRLKALKSLLQLFLEAEVVVKVYEARLAEKVTTSIDPAEVQEYQSTLSLMRSELDQKEGVLHSLEEELTKVGHRSDMDLCLYHEHVKQLSDRWKRILAQINNRLEDLDTYLQQLKHYLNSSSALSAWIRDTKSRIDAQMTTRTDDQAVLNKLLNQQKALNSEITGKRETMDAVQRNGDTCVNTIKNYELDLASYSAGLETLLNIPIKRTMLQSPTTVVIQEVSSLHSRYIELLTRSSNYCKSLGDLLKNLEELKIRNTKIDLLEEELKLLRADVDDCNAKNASMGATLAQYQLKLNESQEHLLSLEEVKRSQALQCSTTKASLNSSQNRLEELMEELSRLKRLVEEEKRNRKIVEERYSSQQEDHEDAMRKRLKELEVANFAKLELEKLGSDRLREIQALKSQLEEETQNLKQAQMEMAKVRQQHSIEIREINQIHESQILVTQTSTQKLSKQLKDDSLTMQMECERLDGERKKLQEELRRLQITLAEEQAQRRDTEALLQQQITAGTEEARKRSELEAQIQLLLSQQRAEESRWQEVQVTSTKSLQEKNSQISTLKQSLDDELHKKRALEATNGHLQKELADLHAKHTTCNQELIKLRSAQQELSILRVEVETQGNERNRAEQNIAHLQTRAKELQEELKQMDGQLNQQIKVTQEEAAKRRKIEAQLENTSQAMREYITTITTLKKSQEEASMDAKRSEEERKKLQDALDRNLKEQGTSSQRLASLDAEVKALRLQLVHEQGRVSEANQRIQTLHRSMEEKTKALNESIAETNRLKKQITAGTEEARKQSELEAQIQLLLSQQRAEESRWQEVQVTSTKSLQEKNSQISTLKQSLDDELHKKRALEATNGHLQKELADLHAKHTTCNQELIKLRSAQQELSILRVEVETQCNERNRAEQNIAHLQTRAKELQEELKQMDGQLNQQIKVAQEEAAKRRKIEAQLENTNQAMREYITTITTLKKSQEEASMEAKRSEEERKKLQDALDRNLKEQGTSSQRLASLDAEVKALRLQLVQEQGRVSEANQRIQTLHRSMEEKTKALNESIAETNRLKKQTETLTKERLSLEEESRAVRLELDKLLQGKQDEDNEMSNQITALQQQLQNSQHARIEHDKLIQQLSQEREKLRLEMQNIQTQASETSSLIRSSQSQCTELQEERDTLLRKVKALEENMSRMQTREEELMKSKMSLETELRLKRQLEEENEKLKIEFRTWKNQHQTQEAHVQQHITVRMALEGECNKLKTHMEQLQSQLKDVEKRYKLQVQGLEQERDKLVTLKDSLQEEVLRLKQKGNAVNRYTQTDLGTAVDPSTLVFDGVRKKVTAQQLHECGVIDKKTLDHLLKGHQTVQDVAVDIKLNLKGTGAIAGFAGPTGKLTFTEAKKDMLISTDTAVKLLEAQAATGHILDPRANLRMTVDEACLNGLVDEGDKKQLLIAEAACIGFRDSTTTKLLSVSQAMKKGMIDQDTALRLLQAQEAAGGILDPVLSVYLSKDIARERNLIDENLYQALHAKPNCYIDPSTNLSVNYISLKRQSKADPNTGMLMLLAPLAPVQGLRGKVCLSHLVEADLLAPSDIDQLREGKLTSQEIQYRLSDYLQGSTCIAGVCDQVNERILPIYQAMKEGLLRPGTTLELLEAQAASGFIIDPVNNQHYTVEEACKKGLVGVEFKDKLLSAERAVTGYKDPGSEKILSLFQAIERGLIEKGHGIRLLEAQIASGGIIDPKQSHRIDVDVAYKKGYFNEEMNQILQDEGDDTKGFFDPNTQENLTYMQLKRRCIKDDKTGLELLPLYNKMSVSKTSTQKNTTRKTRVVIVDPDTNKEMTVHEAFNKRLIDHETYMELSKQESEWEEITVTASDGTRKLVISDRKTGRQYDLKELHDKGVINDDNLHEYRSGKITLTQFVDIITSKSTAMNMPFSSSSSSVSSQTVNREGITSVDTSTSPKPLKHIASMSITVTSFGELIDEQSPVGAIFDTEKSKKMSIFKAMMYGLVDSITAQRLLEAQACTGGIVNPENGRRISIQEATRNGIIDDDMANRLKPAQKAYIGFEDVKTRKKLSAAEAVKEKWLPFEAGQRFLEFQFLTGGLFDPEQGRRRTLDEAVRMGWLDGRASQKLMDTRHHPKMLTCPKTKLRITYKEAMDACIVEDKTGVRMLPAAPSSSHGITSSYNSSPGSAPGSQTGSRRGSVDQANSSSSSARYSFSYSSTSFSSRSLS